MSPSTGVRMANGIFEAQLLMIRLPTTMRRIRLLCLFMFPEASDAIHNCLTVRSSVNSLRREWR
ncbi:MAG: hypothetical protein N0E55_04135, partial [Candidatus Thiodiazotropha taylori]|nr:hypothetical protein [Candidatus Thiodiazotropha taylori]MCW4251880.1 hypothetical protein [Candidatus Thiodiazotropha taylori]